MVANPAITADDTAQRAADAYRATDDAYKDVVRYLERLAGDACKPLVIAEVYAEDHPTSVCAPEAVEAAREVRDFLRHLLYELRRSRPQQAYDAVRLAAEVAAAAAEQEGQR